MTAASPDEQSAAGSGQKTGWYVYGILPGDVELTEDIHGVGGREVRLVQAGDLTALVSEVDMIGPLGTPADLQAHKDILDSVAAGSPVLPLRFGAVLASEDAVVSDLLEPNRDEFVDALDELDGRVEYGVKGQYVESAVLEEILSEDPEAAQLREQIRGQDADATREERIRLGEIIGNAIAAKRDKDTQMVLSCLQDHSVAGVVREPTHELEAVNAAFLVDEEQEDEFVREAEELTAGFGGRVELRILGPMAPYDFVGDPDEGQS